MLDASTLIAAGVVAGVTCGTMTRPDDLGLNAGLSCLAPVYALEVEFDPSTELGHDTYVSVVLPGPGSGEVSPVCCLLRGAMRSSSAPKGFWQGSLASSIAPHLQQRVNSTQMSYVRCAEINCCPRQVSNFTGLTHARLASLLTVSDSAF